MRFMILCLLLSYLVRVLLRRIASGLIESHHVSGLSLGPSRPLSWAPKRRSEPLLPADRFGPCTWSGCGRCGRGVAALAGQHWSVLSKSVQLSEGGGGQASGVFGGGGSGWARLGVEHLQRHLRLGFRLWRRPSSSSSPVLVRRHRLLGHISRPRWSCTSGRVVRSKARVARFRRFRWPGAART